MKYSHTHTYFAYIIQSIHVVFPGYNEINVMFMLSDKSRECVSNKLSMYHGRI